MPGSGREKQEIVCMRVIALLAMGTRVMTLCSKGTLDRLSTTQVTKTTNWINSTTTSRDGNTKCIPESIGLSIDILCGSSQPLWESSSHFHNSFFVCHSFQGKLNAFNVVSQRSSHCSFSALAECFCGQVLVTRGKFGKPLEPGVQSKTK